MKQFIFIFSILFIGQISCIRSWFGKMFGSKVDVVQPHQQTHVRSHDNNNPGTQNRLNEIARTSRNGDTGSGLTGNQAQNTIHARQLEALGLGGDSRARSGMLDSGGTGSNRLQAADENTLHTANLNKDKEGWSKVLNMVRPNTPLQKWAAAAAVGIIFLMVPSIVIGIVEKKATEKDNEDQAKRQKDEAALAKERAANTTKMQNDFNALVEQLLNPQPPPPPPSTTPPDSTDFI